MIPAALLQPSFLGAPGPTLETSLRRAVVTGATGFVGGGLLRALRARGVEVTCLVRGSSDPGPLQALGARVVVGDLLQAGTLAPALDGADVVFHLAAQLRAHWRPDFLRVNQEGCGNVAAACAAQPVPPTLVVVSSLAAGGPAPAGRARVEEDQPAPRSRYGQAKLLGEEAARRYADHVPLTIVRPPIVIGRGDRAARPLLGMLRRGLALVPAGGAFSLVENEDLAGLLLLAAERGERARPDGPPGQGVYYAAADEPLALGELARRLALAAGLPARVLRLPLGLVWLLSLGGEGLGRLLDRPLLLNLDKAREARAGSWVCSPEKARRQLGWTPTPLARHLAQAPGW